MIKSYLDIKQFIVKFIGKACLIFQRRLKTANNFKNPCSLIYISAFNMFKGL